MCSRIIQADQLQLYDQQINYLLQELLNIKANEEEWRPERHGNYHPSGTHKPFVLLGDERSLLEVVRLLCMG